MVFETVFTADASSIVFGNGATREVGPRAVAYGLKRVLLVTDPRVALLPPVANVLDSLKRAGVEADVYDRVRVEPNDASWLDAAAVAIEGDYNGYISVGGGSAIDTAKIANLLATWPADLMDYVYPPLGKGIPVPGALKPHIAVPTTAGTGSETTGNAVFDLASAHVKTAVASRALRPSIGIVDPENTRTMPPMVAAASGLDVLCHALESYTAIPFDRRPAPENPLHRTVYQGANPLSDVWSTRAIEIGAEFLVRAVADPNDNEAREGMMLASTAAGIGFGNAGVHLPHAMSYPVSALARNYTPAGYAGDHAIVPHGISVILTAPAVFRWTAQANPTRHLEAARLLGAETRGAAPDDAGIILADRLVRLMRDVDMPNGLRAVGIVDSDLDDLVRGTLPQSRITSISPRPASEDDYREIFSDSFAIW